MNINNNNNMDIDASRQRTVIETSLECWTSMASRYSKRTGLYLHYNFWETFRENSEFWG